MGLAVAVLGVGALLVIVAIVSRAPRPDGALAGPSIDARSVSVNVLAPVFVVAGVAAVLLAATMHRRRGGRRREYTMAAAASDLLTVAIFAGLLRLVMWVFRDRGDDPGAPPVQPTPAVASPGTGTSGDAAVIGNWRLQLAVAAMTAFALGFLAYRSFRRTGLGPPRRATSAERFPEVIDESLDTLRSERDPRRAVIAAYARMERALAAAGLPRRASEAPGEYLERVLGEMRVSGPAVTQLTRLYELAKFDRRPVDENMRERAIAALVDIRDQLWTAVP